MSKSGAYEPSQSWFDELDLLDYLATDLAAGLLVDVGAHIGRFSERFAQRGWRIVAFEPVPDLVVELRDRLARYDDIRIVPSAVTDTNSESVGFYLSGEHWGIHSLQAFHDSHRSKIEVSSRRLDDALTPEDHRDPTFLKIDTEGADFLSLKGWDFARHRPKIVMCEFMDSRSQHFFGYSHHDIIEYMATFGYATYISEWSPVREYARRGVETTRSVHLGVFPGDIHHEPAWGNLLFVSADDRPWLESRLVRFLTIVQEASWAALFAAGREHAANEQMRTTIENREARISALLESLGRLKLRIDELGVAVKRRDARIEELGVAVEQRDARIAKLRPTDGPDGGAA
jgi:FkbM family methyltransferase